MQEYIQMLLSGAVAVQMIFGGENQEMVDAIVESERIYNLARGHTFTSDVLFEAIIQKASRNTTMHMADPKLRAAITAAVRFLARHRSRFSREELDSLQTLVTRALA
ncbi:MAG: hypothetical protein ACPG3U_07330 [Rhodothermales bacterium]